MNLTMTKPMSCQNAIEFTLQPASEGTDVTWSMSGPWPYVRRVMGTVFNMDKMVGGEFEKGLASLKALAEK